MEEHPSSNVVPEMFQFVSSCDWKVFLIVFLVLRRPAIALNVLFSHTGSCYVLFPQQSYWVVFVFVFRSRLIALCSVSTPLTLGGAQTNYGAANRFEQRTAVLPDLDIVT